MEGKKPEGKSEEKGTGGLGEEGGEYRNRAGLTT